MTDKSPTPPTVPAPEKPKPLTTPDQPIHREPEHPQTVRKES